MTQAVTVREAESAGRDHGEIRAVVRALDLLDLLGHHAEGLRLTELSRESGLSLSTTHRLLGTLSSHGFAEIDADGVTWRVGQAAFIVGSSFAQDKNFVAAALPHLRHLRDSTRETANLGVLHDGFVTILAQVESRQITRAVTQVGGRVPAGTSAMGKALLATYPDSEIAAMVRRHGLARLTRNSPTRLPQLLERVHKARDDGYALDDEEATKGIRCIAATVYGQSGDPLCAISISGISERLTPARLDQFSTMIKAAAARLSHDLGGNGYAMASN